MGICGSTTKPSADGQDGVKDPAKNKPQHQQPVQPQKANIESPEKKENTGGVTMGTQSPAVVHKGMAQEAREVEKVHIEQKPIEANHHVKEHVEKSKKESEEKERQEKEKEQTKPPKSPTDQKHEHHEKKEGPKPDKKSNMQSHEVSRDVDLAEKRANKKRAKVIDVVDEKESGYFETFVKVEKRKNADDTANILNSLLGHFFFSNLSHEEL